MLTDDDVRDRLVRDLHTVLDPVTASPSLLRDLHSQHVRRPLAVPLSLALVGSATAAAVVLWPSSPGRPVERLAASPTATAVTPGEVVKLFDYSFTLPAGFVVTEQPHVVDLGKAQPRQPVAGQTASFAAAKGESKINVTVYRGDIADGEAAVVPPRPDTLQRFTIADHPATATTMAAGGPECVTRENGRSVMRVDATGPCGQETIEFRVSSASHELIWVTSSDVPQTDIHAMLERAL